MVAEFCQFISSENLFTTRDRLLVAVSGGLDSTALVHLLATGGFTFGVGHCNFQLRGEEAEKDARFVRELAEVRKLPYHEARFATEDLRQPGESIQMCARRLRYAWLEEIRVQEAYDFILTAHHSYDSLETMLLNFVRGTGLAGLRGIPLHSGYLRRPLLFCGRPQLENWVQEQKIAYREDASNATDKYRRNQIRHQVLPVLEAMNPAFAETLFQNFAHLRAAYAIYREAIKKHSKRLLQATDDGWKIEKALLERQPEPATVFYEILRDYNFDQEQVRQLLSAKTGTLLETDRYQILVNSENWVLQEKDVTSNWEVSIYSSDERVELSNSRHLLLQSFSQVPKIFPKSKDEIVVDQGKIVFPLHLRYWRAGDTFQPFGMQGRQQKLQDYFVNNKIDRLQRKQIPLLFNGNGDLIWVVGERMDERFRVTDHTVNVLKLSLYAVSPSLE